MEFNGYCVRVDALDGYRDKIISLKTVTDYASIVAVEHKGSTKENPHYHLVIKTDVKDQAFRVRLKKVFNKGKGNGHMAIKTWDGNIDAIAYLFHEQGDDAELVLQHNVSNETIEKAKARNRDVQSKIEEAKDRAAWRLEDVVYEQVKSDAKRQYQPEEVAKMLILTALRNNKYMPNDYLIKAMVTRIMFRLLDGDVHREEHFAEGIVQNIFHRYG